MEEATQADKRLYWPSIRYGHDRDGRNKRISENVAENTGRTDGFCSTP